MSIAEEPPLPADGPWAVPSGLRLAVVGTGGLAARLRRCVPVLVVGPRDDPAEVCREADALLLELSAFERRTGGWAHALRPGGFDRGTALARLLRTARSTDRPVLAIDDLPSGSRDAWQGVLATALDDVAPLGPVVDGGLTWNPGMHWSAAALGLHVRARLAAGVGEPWRWQHAGDWEAIQARAVAHDRAVLDLDDPWQRHLGDELALLGVAVRAHADGPPLHPAERLLPSTALRRLCDRLGLAAPDPLMLAVVGDVAPEGADRREAEDMFGPGLGFVTASDVLAPAAVLPDVVLVPMPGAALDAAAAAACRDALDRAPEVVAVASRGAAVVGIRGQALQPLFDDGEAGPRDARQLHALARRQAAPREVG